MATEHLQKGPAHLHGASAFGGDPGHLPSCHSGEHMVCSIQMGSVGSSIATPMLARQMEPERQFCEPVGCLKPDSSHIEGSHGQLTCCHQDVRVFEKCQKWSPHDTLGKQRIGTF